MEQTRLILLAELLQEYRNYAVEQHELDLAVQISHVRQHVIGDIIPSLRPSE